MQKVVLCGPTIRKPHDACIASIRHSILPVMAAGWDEGFITEISNQYISLARAVLLKKAMDAKADVIVFLDHDLSWDRGDLLKLIETEGDVVGGTYRYRRDPAEYMGRISSGADSRPIVRESDGALESIVIPGGFMKLTRQAVVKMQNAHPELSYQAGHTMAYDLFQHGAHKYQWYSEDFAFCRRWTDLGEKIWTVPDLNITHHEMTGDKSYPGNLHQFLLRPKKPDITAIPLEAFSILTV
jgi:glycosyltransferase involved in cell wall biosynthesis